MSESEFCIYNAVNMGQVKKVLDWLDWAEPEMIRARVGTMVLLLELQHCSGECVGKLVDALGNKIVTKGIKFFGLQAVEREKWTAIFYIKAYWVNRENFKGALDILKARKRIVEERLGLYDAEAVLAAEETYFGNSMRIVQEQAMTWDEYMGMSYMSRDLVKEMLLFQRSETHEERRKQYTKIFGRPLTEKENGMLKGYECSRAQAFLDWLKEYVAYLQYMCTKSDDEISEILLDYAKELHEHRYLSPGDFAHFTGLLRTALSICEKEDDRDE